MTLGLGSRWGWWSAVALLACTLSGLAAWGALERAISGAQVPGLSVPVSTQVLDRDGRLLRAFPVQAGRYRLPVDLCEVDPAFIDLLLAVEDRRFRDHRGVDPVALARAGLQLLTRGRIISGGSTISMQLVRLLTTGTTRTPSRKLSQIILALALERQLTRETATAGAGCPGLGLSPGKAAILAAYLQVTPYGGNLEGLSVGSLAWLGKTPERLSLAESALLVALPQAPEARRPDRDGIAARRARDRIIRRARDLGLVDERAAEMALRSPVPVGRRPFPMLAAHVAGRVVRASPGRSVHRLTLDGRLQERLESLAAARARALGPRVSAAILVADHRTGEVLASVGSAGFTDVARDGFIDMIRAPRSPGSTLKPLIYGLAFELGIAHPESLIEDRPTAFAGYVPTNFDQGFQGTVTVRQALASSLNVPAVQLLDAVGPARLLSRLRRAGTAPELPEGRPAGLAIGLGGLGLTLTDLVRVYAAIARGGRSLTLTETLGGPASGAGERVLEPPAAWYLGSILQEAPLPATAAITEVAFKTGTSYGYRDAWAIGFDGRHVAGVWLGRPDAVPVPGLIGLEAAAPMLLDTFAALGPTEPLPGPPPGVLTAGNAELPPTLRHARVGGAVPIASSSPGPEIAFPPDGARLPLGRGDKLPLKVRHGLPPFVWLVDGSPVAREPFRRATNWTPRGSGFTVVSVVDALGRGSRVRVYLENAPGNPQPR